MIDQQRPSLFGAWRKSSYSSGGDNCLQVAVTTDGHIGLRDSKNPDQGPQVVTRAAWTAFLAQVARGGLDR